MVRAARKSENLLDLGQDVLAFLRKMGYGNATQWLKTLDFAKYQNDILNAVNELARRISDAARFIHKRMGAVRPQGVNNTLQALPQGMARIRAKAGSMVPKAIKELNDNLNKVRQHITDGSYIAPITVAGKKPGLRHRGATGEPESNRGPHRAPTGFAGPVPEEKGVAGFEGEGA